MLVNMYFIVKVLLLLSMSFINTDINALLFLNKLTYNVFNDSIYIFYK